MIHKLRFLLPMLLVLASAWMAPVRHGDAADIDIFMQPNTGNSSLPNVLIVLDNTSNWSQSASSAGGDLYPTKFAFERTALATWARGLVPDDGDGARADVGLMMFSETGNTNPDPSGGYVRYAIRPMNTLNGPAFANLVDNLDENDDKGNGAEYALAMHEAYLYFKGQTARSGIKEKTDTGDPTVIDLEPAYDPNDNGVWDEGIHGAYRTPELDDVCKKNYVIFISNGAPDNGENNTAEDLLDALGGKAVTDPIDLDPSQRQQNWSDEYTRFMALNNISTYSIDVLPQGRTQGLSNTQLLKSMADQGGGKYYAVTEEDGDPAQQLIDALNDALQDIVAVETVFAASALPVSVNVQNRDTNLNQVYIGMFRPDANRRPRWLGNLKLYEIGLVGDELSLVDTNYSPVQDPGTGFVRSGVVSFWTHDSSFWAFKGEGYPASDSPDGPTVEKGAAAQMQRENSATRRFFTCVSCTAGITLSDHLFNTDNSDVTTALLGAADGDEREDLIEWVRGEDNTNPSESGVEDSVRPSVQGDIVHSSPALVNYGNDIVAFYGSNDGLYRAVRGVKELASGGGRELWAFVAPEFYPELKRLRDNAIDVKVPYNNPSAEQASDLNRPFFFDGNTAVYQLDADDDGLLREEDDDGNATGDKVYLYLTPRRGGKFIYALDVTDPDEPDLLWKRSAGDSGYEELGQVWSTPMLRKLLGVTNPVLILGAGYDPDTEDALPAGTANEGRGILVVDALDGTVIWQAGPSPVNATHNLTVSDMVYPLASDIAVVDLNEDGRVDVGYVGDTGGQLWRINFADPAGGGSPATWAVHKLANLGNAAGSTDRRKFLYPPDVLRIDEVCDATAAQAGALAILIGSGDREHPLAMSVYNDLFATSPTLGETANRFYMLRDNAPLSASVTALTESDLTDVTSTDTVPDASSGWYLQLAGGEKVVGNSLTINSHVFFGTSLPPPPLLNSGTCSPFGEARTYRVQYCNGAPPGDTVDGSVTGTDRYVEIPGGGLLPPLVPAVVTGLTGENDDKVYHAVIAGLNVFNAGQAANTDNRKTFWYEEKGD